MTYSGLIQMRDGNLAFTDTDCEERWIASMVQQDEAKWKQYEHDLELDAMLKDERDRWAEEDDEAPWRRREKPSGLMYYIEDKGIRPSER